MEVSFSRKKRPPYINFRMRKLINNFILENSISIYSLPEKERAQYIANEIEKIVCENYWIKDKRKDISNVVSINKKVA